MKTIFVKFTGMMQVAHHACFSSHDGTTVTAEELARLSDEEIKKFFLVDNLVDAIDEAEMFHLVHMEQRAY